MTVRRCLDCRRPTTLGSRCATCTRHRNAARNAAKPHHHGRHPARARALKATSAANGAPCWLCGQPIDYQATGGPWSFHADHVTPGDPDSELRPAHARCNESRGANGGGSDFW